MTERKFFKTIVKVEILSETPLEGDIDDLNTIAYIITHGGCSGAVIVEGETILNGKEAADALINQNSEPSFFSLTEEGNDLDDE